MEQPAESAGSRQRCPWALTHSLRGIRRAQHYLASCELLLLPLHAPFQNLVTEVRMCISQTQGREIKQEMHAFSMRGALVGLGLGEECCLS